MVCARETRKPCWRKETARCRSCSFRFKVRQQHSLQFKAADTRQTMLANKCCYLLANICWQTFVSHDIVTTNKCWPTNVVVQTNQFCCSVVRPFCRHDVYYGQPITAHHLLLVGQQKTNKFANIKHCLPTKNVGQLFEHTTNFCLPTLLANKCWPTFVCRVSAALQSELGRTNSSNCFPQWQSVNGVEG